MTIRHVLGQRVLLDDGFAAAHLKIESGRISAVEEVSVEELERRATTLGDGPEVLRAPPGTAVLPGIVDTHVHINEPGRTRWEGFATATTAAALGGVTTVVDMPLNSIPPTTTVEALRRKQEAARGRTRVDVGFWGGIVPGNLAELRPLWEAGVMGFKCFLLPSGVEEFPPVSLPELRAAMAEVAAFDGLVIVHAEDADIVGAGDSSPTSDYSRWAATRPHDAEVAAITALLEVVRETGCRTHILHLASARALDILADARREGLPVTVETCPHYLIFDAEQVPSGAAEFKCCPPIRDAGNREALWQGLQEGIIDCVVTDHSPATVEEKRRGAPDLQQAWGGISGLQTGFAAVADQAARRGIGLEQVVEWMAGRTAELVGLRGKGALRTGADADVVLHDPEAAQRIRVGELAHRNPISAYDGMRLSGAVVGTILRGELIHRPGDRRSGDGTAGAAVRSTGRLLSR